MLASFQYSLNNHYRWGWGTDETVWYNDPIAGAPFRFSLGTLTREPGSLRSELNRAVEHFAGQVTKPTVIGLSGGYDSQAACLAFLDVKAPFQPVIVKLKTSDGSEYNTHDVEGAFEFCEKFNLAPLVEELDLDKFYRTKALELAREHCICNARTLPQLYVADRFAKTHSFVMAGGDPVVSKSSLLSGLNEHALAWSQGPTPIQQHLIKRGYEGVTKLFMYSPELIYSFVNNPHLQAFQAASQSIYEAYFDLNIVDNRELGWWRCFTYFIKPLFYVEQWPELIQRRKFTGFEKVPHISAVAEMIGVVNRRYRVDLNKVVLTLDQLLESLRAPEPVVWYPNVEKLWKLSRPREAQEKFTAW